MSKAQFEALSKRVDAQDAKITKLEEQNAELTEKLAALVKPEPKKKAPAKSKTVKVEKVKAGAGGPDEEEESPEIKQIKHKIALSENYIADESKSEANRKKRTNQLETERKKLRDLTGETAADEKKEDAPPVELPIEELQALDLDVSGTPGIYRDADGRLVTGPPEDPKEELKDTKFEKQMYSVGQTTFRVYQGASAKSSFKGYAGVANFKEMVEDASDSE